MQQTDRQTYRDRAIRARELAGIEKDSSNEVALLGLANSYDELLKELDRAERRERQR